MARLERLLWALGAAAIVALGLLIAVNVLLREVFASQLPDSVVMVRELMVAAILLPLAAATAARAHIAVEFITDHLSPRARSRLIVMGSVVGLLGLAPLLWAGGRELIANISDGAFFYGDLNLPRWPGRALFVIGVGACMIRLALLIWQDIRTLRAGGVVEAAPPEKAE
ncbi:MAG: TRAP transporter small permease subunit [Pseudomonadota bacterium]